MKSVSPSKKWLKMAEVYRYFARAYKDLDFSEEAALEMYLYESNGTTFIRFKNGYYLGKHLMDLNLAMWKESIRLELLTVQELYEWLPEDMHPWLDKVFNK